jgi:hypothetical protein
MLNLDKVTLVGVDGKDSERTINVLLHCQELCRFPKTLFFSKYTPAAWQSLDLEYRYAGIDSREEYCNFIVRDLPHHIETEFFMIVQHDGFIVNPNAWTDDFYRYDYLGSPWPIDLLRRCGYSQFTSPVNGGDGFSLRSTQLARAASAIPGPTYPADNFIAIWHRNRLESMGFEFAPLDVAFQFSVESHAYEGSFGCHGPMHVDFLNSQLLQVSN